MKSIIPRRFDQMDRFFKEAEVRSPLCRLSAATPLPVNGIERSRSWQRKAFHCRLSFTFPLPCPWPFHRRVLVFFTVLVTTGKVRVTVALKEHYAAESSDEDDGPPRPAHLWHSGRGV